MQTSRPTRITQTHRNPGSRIGAADRRVARIESPADTRAFRAAIAAHGAPASVLSDNGMVFTTRFAGGRARAKTRNGFETELARLGIEQKNSSPNHPQTCGKVERLHQTQKRWLAAQPDQPSTITALQVLLERFADEYNTRRPHRSLARRTPAAAYLARPKATPDGHDSPADVRVRRDRVDTSGVVTLRFHGRLHHIGIGRAHARTHVLLLVQDRDIRVVNATTGDLIRELILDPSRDYQPLRHSPHSKKPRTHEGSGLCRCRETPHAWARQDSNLRPLDPQSSALPSCATSRTATPESATSETIPHGAPPARPRPCAGAAPERLLPRDRVPMTAVTRAHSRTWCYRYLGYH